MGINRKDQDPGDITLWGFFLFASVADVVLGSTLLGLTAPNGGELLRPREERCPPERCDRRFNQVRRVTELLRERTKSFQDSVEQNGVSHDRSRRRQGFCQLSDRSSEAVACG